MTTSTTRIPAAAGVFKIAPKDATLVQLGAEHGFAQFVPILNSQLPGGARRGPRADGSVSTLGGGFDVGAFTFVVLDSDDMAAMLWACCFDNTATMDHAPSRAGSIGALFDFEYGPDGDTAGLPKFTGTATVRADAARVSGLRIYRVTMTVTGAVAAGSYA